VNTMAIIMTITIMINVTCMVFYPPVLLGGMIKSYITL
jgi:hypothetical protein